MKTLIAFVLLFSSLSHAQTPCEQLNKMMWNQYHADHKVIEAIYQVGDMSVEAFAMMTTILDDELSNHEADLKILCPK